MFEAFIGSSNSRVSALGVTASLLAICRIDIFVSTCTETPVSCCESITTASKTITAIIINVPNIHFRCWCDSRENQLLNFNLKCYLRPKLDSVYFHKVIAHPNFSGHIFHFTDNYPTDHIVNITYKFTQMRKTISVTHLQGHCNLRLVNMLLATRIVL